MEMERVIGRWADRQGERVWGKLLSVQGGGSLKRQQSSLFPDASVCWIQLSVQDVLREGKRGRTGPNKTEKRELRHQEKERWWKTGGRGRGQVIEKSKAMKGKIGIKVICLCHFSKSSKSLLLHFQMCPDCIPLLSHHKKPNFICHKDQRSSFPCPSCLSLKQKFGSFCQISVSRVVENS